MAWRRPTGRASATSSGRWSSGWKSHVTRSMSCFGSTHIRVITILKKKVCNFVGGETTRILIVDDHPTNVAILEEILEEHYTLKTATCGEEALAIALDFQPALILLDIMMPGIGGYETCRRIRAHPALRNIKIIMVSARALVAERLQGYEAGADDYITKPFDEEELVAKVRVHMRLRSLEEVEQFTSNVLTLLRHETRTPLNGLLAPIQMLRAEAEMAVEERGMLLDMVYES